MWRWTRSAWSPDQMMMTREPCQKKKKKAANQKLLELSIQNQAIRFLLALEDHSWACLLYSVTFVSVYGTSQVKWVLLSFLYIVCIHVQHVVLSCCRPSPVFVSRPVSRQPFDLICVILELQAILLYLEVILDSMGWTDFPRRS